MAAYNPFNSWVEYLCEGANAGSDQFAVALTNSAPSASNSVIADISQVSYTNCSSRNVTTSTASQSAGTYSVVVNDLTLTASGGPVGPFQWVVVFDDTVAGDPLVSYYNYGSAITLADGETFLLNFGATLFTVAIG